MIITSVASALSMCKVHYLVKVSPTVSTVFYAIREQISLYQTISNLFPCNLKFNFTFLFIFVFILHSIVVKSHYENWTFRKPKLWNQHHLSSHSLLLVLVLVLLVTGKALCEPISFELEKQINTQKIHWLWLCHKHNTFRSALTHPNFIAGRERIMRAHYIRITRYTRKWQKTEWKMFPSTVK